MSNSFPLPLNESDEMKYLKRSIEGDPDARQKLIEHNLRLVAHVAKKYSATGIPADDLISIGTIGLIKGINTYNLEKSTRLATYVAKCIENEILMSIRSSRKIKTEISLNVPIGTDKDGNSISFDDILGTEPNEILDSIHLRMQTKKLLSALDEVLTPREKEIIVNRYGLLGKDAKTQREIASTMNISRSYVSRIEKKAVGKLREYMENK